LEFNLKAAGVEASARRQQLQAAVNVGAALTKSDVGPADTSLLLYSQVIEQPIWNVISMTAGALGLGGLNGWAAAGNAYDRLHGGGLDQLG